jgi:hypothetical protein
MTAGTGLWEEYLGKTDLLCGKAQRDEGELSGGPEAQ